MDSWVIKYFRSYLGEFYPYPSPLSLSFSPFLPDRYQNMFLGNGSNVFFFTISSNFLTLLPFLLSPLPTFPSFVPFSPLKKIGVSRKLDWGNVFCALYMIHYWGKCNLFCRGWREETENGIKRKENGIRRKKKELEERKWNWEREDGIRRKKRELGERKWN